MMSADIQAAYKTFKSDPASRSQFISLAKALRDEAAYADLIRAARLYESSGSDTRLGRYYQRWALFSWRRYDDALAVATAMTRGEDVEANDFSWMAKILTRMGRHDEAIKAVQGALLTWPGHEGLVENLAIAQEKAGAVGDPRVAATAPAATPPAKGVRPDRKMTGKRRKVR